MGDTDARGSTRLLILVVVACVAASLAGVAVAGVGGDGRDPTSSAQQAPRSTTSSSAAPGGEVTLPTAVELDDEVASPTVDLGEAPAVPADAPVPPASSVASEGDSSGTPVPRSEVMTVFVDGLPFLVVEPEDRPSYAGRELELDGALVSAASDAGFWVGEGRHATFVTWGDADRVPVAVGDRISGRGLLRTPPPAGTQLGVSDPQQLEALQEQRVYVHSIALARAEAALLELACSSVRAPCG